MVIIGIEIAGFTSQKNRKRSGVVEEAIKELEKYLPVAVSEIANYGELSLVRFSSVITGFDFESDKHCTYWYFRKDSPKIIVWLDKEMEDLSETLIQKIFGDDVKHLEETINFLRSLDWRGEAVTVYGMIISIEEEADLVYFQAFYIFPQTIQAELNKKSIMPTKKLVVGKVTEKVAEDFEQRKKQIAKLLRQRKI